MVIKKKIYKQIKKILVTQQNKIKWIINNHNLKNAKIVMKTL